MMLSYLVRRSLPLASRSYRLIRTMSVACNRRPLQISNGYLHSHARAVSTTCFRFTSGSTSGTTNIITVEDVERHVQQNDSIIIDVRTFNETVEFGKIPTAHVLPVEDIESAMRLSADEFNTKYGFTKPLPTGQPVIVYCLAGVRAAQAAKTFTEQFGFTSVMVYSGSWQDWAQRHPEHTKKPLK